MNTLLAAIIIAALSPGAPPRIEKLIDSGEFESAYELLLDELDKRPHDEETLYLLGMTAPGGQRSSLYLKEYLQRYPDGRRAGQVRRRLLDYYVASGLNITAAGLYDDTGDLEGLSPQDRFRIAIVKQRLGEYKDAVRFYETLTGEADKEMQSWALLAIADCNLLSDDYDSAVKGYQVLIDRYSKSPSVPFALIGLSEAYRRMGNLDEATLYYQLYREEYQSSPGSDEIEAAILEGDTGENERSRPPGIEVSYFIQVGVFAHKDNARACLRKFRNIGFRSRLQEFSERGKTYFRVIVGPFTSEQAARDKKQELEKSQGEEYLILLQ